jgi:hypothetical protein
MEHKNKTVLNLQTQDQVFMSGESFSTDGECFLHPLRIKEHTVRLFHHTVATVPTYVAICYQSNLEFKKEQHQTNAMATYMTFHVMLNLYSLLL